VPVGDFTLQIDDKVVARIVRKKKEVPSPQMIENEIDSVESSISTTSTSIPTSREKIRGRLSLATYNTFSAQQQSMRMRYGLRFRGEHLHDSRFSVDSYVIFRHNSGQWSKIQDRLGNGLKVFNMALGYEVSKSAKLTLGRTINPKFASVGAMDGLQYEQKMGDFSVGAVVGFRPDFETYGFNPNLLQYGAFVSHTNSKTGTYAQTTLGFMQQSHSSATDRRFMYFQHGSQLAKGLNLFSSFELDLYEQVNGQVSTSPKLTNLYLSLRYRLSKAIRISAAFDSRRQIIFFESYKSFIDQLIEDETRQGVRLGVSYRPSKNISISLNGHSRFQQSGANPVQNLSTNVGIRQLPWLNARASISANLMQNSFLNSQIYGLRLSKNTADRALTGEVYYRWVDYQYRESVTKVQQHIAGASWVLRLTQGLSMNLFYEGVFESQNIYHRVNARLIQRF